MTDDFTIGGATIKSLQMGLANDTTGSIGVIGIGYGLDEASVTSITSVPYPNLIDEMVSQGLIETKAYSLYLDNLEEATGSIIFGGVDTDKFMYVSNLLAMLPSSTITDLLSAAL
jgi:hypothetical protein